MDFIGQFCTGIPYVYAEDKALKGVLMQFQASSPICKYSNRIFSVGPPVCGSNVIVFCIGLRFRNSHRTSDVRA